MTFTNFNKRKNSSTKGKLTNFSFVKLSRNVNSPYLLLILLLCVQCKSTEGVFVETPKNATVIVNQSTFFNCSRSSNQSREPIWYHHPVDGNRRDVYDFGKVKDRYIGRFDIDKNATSGIYNLLIKRPEPADAGRYECVENVDLDTGPSAELTVLDSNMVCESDKDPYELPGPTACNLNMTQDQLQLMCIVSYSGNILPQLQWTVVGNAMESLETMCGERGSNSVMCNATLKSSLNMTESVYICHMITAPQYNCSWKVSKIIYALPYNSVETITTSMEEVCSANTSMGLPCSYKWLKDNTTVQLGDTLKPSQTGRHTCEALCTIRNEQCAFTAMAVDVSESGTGVNVGLLVGLLVMAIIVIALGIVAGLKFRAWKKKAQLTSEEKVPLAERGIQGIRDLTVLDQDLFITRYERKDIEVYDSAEFHFKRRMKVDGMTKPESIASCSVNNCLYIVDQSHQELHNAILRIDLSNGNVINAWKLTGALSEISVASDANLIICPYNSSDLYEYTADGELIRMIDLGQNPVDMTLRFSAAHAVKLDNGLFVVCQFDPGEVYLISTKETSNTLGRIDEVEILKRFSEELGDLNDSSWWPTHLSVDKEGSILVSDSYNKRAVLLNSNFHKARILISKEDEMESPWKTCFNESTGEWIVADNYRICVCRVEGEAIERQIHELFSH